MYVYGLLDANDAWNAELDTWYSKRGANLWELVIHKTD